MTIITGTAGPDDLTDTAGNDVITGLGGNDRITAGRGADQIDGGTSLDTLILEWADRTTALSVSESSTPGSGTYHDGDDSTFANIEQFVIHAGSGADTLRTATTGYDDIVSGGAGADDIRTFTGADILEGGLGADRLDGGADFDIATYEHAATAITLTLANSGINGTGEAAGDTFFGIEGFRLTGFNDTFTVTATNGAAVLVEGGAGADTLTTAGGNDTLDGGVGADVLAGGMGDDIYVVDDAGDTVNEALNAGHDTVRSAVAYVLGSTLEDLTLTGTAAVNGTGNGAANVLIGNASANILNGMAGADRMEGGLGDDTYYVDDIGDVLVDTGGISTVYSTVSFRLLDAMGRGNITLLGDGDINATGNDASANILVGNSGDNELNGRRGDDTMIGGLGDDTYTIGSFGDVIVENAGEGIDTVRSGIDDDEDGIGYTLGDNLENLTLFGDANRGTGNALDNVLRANNTTYTGNILDGRAGADTMYGSDKGDRYYVDNSGDTVVETGPNPSSLTDYSHTDYVYASINYTLSANVEYLILSGAAISGTGNAIANGLSGTTFDNILDGGAGADRMYGGAGSDTYFVDDVGDQITELATDAGIDEVFASVTYNLHSGHIENLTLTGTAAINASGNSLNNILTGNAGDNVLDGEAGADRMSGGVGSDTYYVDNVGDTVIEGDFTGVDLVFSSVSFSLADQYAENLTLTGAAALSATGNGLANILLGNSGANFLNGVAGADRMEGGAGDDTYWVDNAGDIVKETSAANGLDTVMSAISYKLTANVENLVLTGADAINGNGTSLANSLTGNGAANTLSGGAGNDLLDGGAGADTLLGGADNDTYVVDNAGDIVKELLATDGVDTVLSSISYKLTANVENLTLTGTGSLSANGTSLDNIIIGNSGANRISGGAGADKLTGGVGADVFLYKATTDSNLSAYDRITDFSSIDSIDLSAVDANTNVAGDQAFAIVSAFTHVAGQMTLSYSSTSKVTTVLMDVNGDGAADMKIVLEGDRHTYTNFVF